MAWKQEDCAATIARLRSVGRAILGTELWSVVDGNIYTAIRTKAGPAIYCTACDPVENEGWNDYVERSARLAINWIEAFRWPEDSTEPRTPVYFNTEWVDREWFREHGHTKFEDA